MSVHFHRYENKTLMDNRLRGTNRDIYDFMLALSYLNSNDLTISITEIAEGIGKSYETTRIHLNQIIRMGFIKRIIRKDATRKKWNLKNRYIIIDIAPDITPQTVQPEPVEYVIQGDLPQKIGTPLLKNRGGKRSLEELREGIEDTLKREAHLPASLSNPDQIPQDQATLTPTVTPTRAKNPEPQKPSNQGKTYDLSGVPDIMRHAVIHLLRETGRSAIKQNELEPLRELSQTHTPERVMKEIDKCIERFQSSGRRIDGLNFCYIAACLGNQRSYDPSAPKKKRTHRNKKGENPIIDSIPVQEVAPEVPEAILPLEEAEKIISEYAQPELPKETAIPVALEELFEKIQVKEDEKADEYYASLPKDADGCYVFPEDEPDDVLSITVEDYLRLKYPEAEDEELYRDYYGTVHESYEDFPDRADLERAKAIDDACANCLNPECCLLPRGSRKGDMRPNVMLKTDKRGRKYVSVGIGGCIKCKHDNPADVKRSDPEFERRLKRSGLSEAQAQHTFSSYEHEGMSPELVSAKAKAILVAKNHTSLILAGKPGTGKTHLATAIALEVMRGGKQALFRTVPEMLDTLRKAAHEHSDFFEQIQKLKDAPCLILDDWGKEKTTQAGLDYLYQIIDYRYRYGKQTIATTNALTMNGLINAWNADKIEPLVSRIVENGEWVTIRNAKNHRLCKKPLKLSEPKTAMPELSAETSELYAKIKEQNEKRLEQSNAYYESLPRDEDGCIVFPEDAPDFFMTLGDYLHLKFPEAEEEELRTDYDGTVHEDYSGFSEHRKMEKAFRIDEACANCTDPENCGLPFGICKGLRYPVIVRKKNPSGKWCVCVEYAGELICKHNCEKCATNNAVKEEKSSTPVQELAKPEAVSKPAPAPTVDDKHRDIASALGMRVNFDEKGDIISSPKRKQASEPGTWEADPYEQEVIERERKEAEFQEKKREFMRQMEEAMKAKAEAEKLGMNDADLWKDDEDEYELPGDSRYRKHDRDEDHEAGV